MSDITGKVIQILPEQKFNGKKGEIVKNAFVIEWQDNGYTQKLCLEVVGLDKWDKMRSSVVVGYDVQVRFNVTSREYQGRFYTSASCFYCRTVGSQTMQRQPEPPIQNMPPSNDTMPF